jgi:hypothetical protein
MWLNIRFFVTEGPPMRFRTVAAVSAALALSAAGAGRPAGAQAPAEDALIKKARAIHERVIALDTHADISPANFTAERNYTQRLDNQVNLPKMLDGGLDAAFFIVDDVQRVAKELSSSPASR